MASTSSNIKVAIQKAFRRLKYNAGRFGGGLECSLVFALFPRWPDCVLLIVCVWMLAFSASKILLELLSNFSSFSTLWKHALHTQSEGRSSVLLPPTLGKSSLILASTDGEVPRRRRLHESLTTLLQNGHFQTFSILHSATTAALITRFMNSETACCLLTTWEIFYVFWWFQQVWINGNETLGMCTISTRPFFPSAWYWKRSALGLVWVWERDQVISCSRSTGSRLQQCYL